jgi:hypothetical protein
MTTPKKPKELISVKAKAEFIEELAELADEKNIDFPDFIRFILFEYVENERKSKQNRV